jgi:hypothetical protein
MPNLPIFSQSNSVKTLTPTTSTPITQNSNFNATPLFFAIPPQMFSFMQNSSQIIQLIHHQMYYLFRDNQFCLLMNFLLS